MRTLVTFPYRRILFYVLVVGFFLSSAGHAFAQLAAFQPLANSIPQIAGATDLCSLLSGLFILIIGLAAILAVIMVGIGGLQYMGSDSFSSKGAAKERITDAVIGLMLILGSILLLTTINPNILELCPLRNAPPVRSTAATLPGAAGGPGNQGGGGVVNGNQFTVQGSCSLTQVNVGSPVCQCDQFVSGPGGQVATFLSRTITQQASATSNQTFTCTYQLSGTGIGTGPGGAPPPPPGSTLPTIPNP